MSHCSGAEAAEGLGSIGERKPGYAKLHAFSQLPVMSGIQVCSLRALHNRFTEHRGMQRGNASRSTPQDTHRTAQCA